MLRHGELSVSVVMRAARHPETMKRSGGDGMVGSGSASDEVGN
jgi:hypothetical protein